MKALTTSQLDLPPRKDSSARDDFFYAQTRLPTTHGLFDMRVYIDKGGREHLAISVGNLRQAQNLPLRIHSECLTSEVFGSLKCDCKQQLDVALAYLQTVGRGLLLYLRQEGRGIGLGNKIRAYALQERGHDTVEANALLGLPNDARTYEAAALMLCKLEVSSVQLMTNNPSKIEALKSLGINVVSRIPIIVATGEHAASYLETKRLRMGHLLEGETLENEY
jgi:GTP cyclohydrolase II